MPKLEKDARDHCPWLSFRLFLSCLTLREGLGHSNRAVGHSLDMKLNRWEMGKAIGLRFSGTTFWRSGVFGVEFVRYLMNHAQSYGILEICRPWSIPNKS